MSEDAHFASQDDGLDVRRAHLLALGDELGELEADLAVVDGGRNHGCANTTASVKGSCRQEVARLGQRYIHWTKPMSLPVRPPMLLMALPAAPAALERPDSADDETFERPCEAWLAPLEAALAASDVVEAWRTAMRPIWGVRRSIRDTEKDMMKAWRNVKGVELEGCVVWARSCAGDAQSKRLQIYLHWRPCNPDAVPTSTFSASILFSIYTTYTGTDFYILH